MTQDNAPCSAQRRAFIESLLRRYPIVESNELNEMKRWFHKEATALEVGLIASDPSLARTYRQFADEHIDPLTPIDLLYATMAVAAVVLIFAAVLIFAM